MFCNVGNFSLRDARTKGLYCGTFFQASRCPWRHFVAFTGTNFCSWAMSRTFFLQGHMYASRWKRLPHAGHFKEGAVSRQTQLVACHEDVRLPHLRKKESRKVIEPFSRHSSALGRRKEILSFWSK